MAAANHQPERLVVDEENALEQVSSANDWWFDGEYVQPTELNTIDLFQKTICCEYRLNNLKYLALNVDVGETTMKQLLTGCVPNIKHLEIGFQIRKRLDLNLPKLKSL